LVSCDDKLERIPIWTDLFLGVFLEHAPSIVLHELLGGDEGTLCLSIEDFVLSRIS
jgi:hypothetical protein